ncbi:T9SS type A sorting domain-containing protein [Terrimonas alba]|uniref:T9SS type A sorting domain-containing protein n=1 Tax=Terrimonas alba TaxID=3349636 RepID=UPI0035F38C13
MKKIYFGLAMVLATTTLWSQTTRRWVGPDNGLWTSAINWETGVGAPGVPQTGDLVVFDDGTTRTVLNVPTITLGGLTIANTSTVTLQNTSSANTITIQDGPNVTDFRVEGGSVLTLGNGVYPNGISIHLQVDQFVKASIAGTFIINFGTSYETDFNAVSTSVSGIIENRGLVTGTETRLLFLSGSTYIHAEDEGDIPDANFDPESTVRITGMIFDAPRFLNRAFGNFVWDAPGQKRVARLAAAGMSVAGTFSVVNTGESRLQMDQENLSVGNFNQSGGNFAIGTDNTVAGLPVPTSRTLNVSGDVSITGGDLFAGIYAALGGIGTINVMGDFSLTGGRITENGAGKGVINFAGTAVQSFTKTEDGVIAQTIDFNINPDAKVDFGTSILNGGAGLFTLNAGGKIITSNPAGLGGTGSIRISRIFSSAADYEFQGPTTGVFTTTGGAAGQVRSLIINNSTTGEVIAARSFLVSDALTLTNGHVTTTATNLITVGFTGTASTLNGAFVNGPLAKMTTVQGQSFTFPVGKVDGGLRTIGITPQNGTNNTYRAEFFREAPPVGTIGTGLTRVSGCEYWTMNRTAGNAPARVTLSWAANSSCNGGAYVSQPLDLRVARLEGTVWTDKGNDGITGTLTAGTVQSGVIGGGINNAFALASSSAANPLPVVFANVRAYEKNAGVQIEWSNLTEKDVATYTVERSSNGRDFSGIAEQLPTSNQNDQADYSAFDASPFAGVNYYRIKAVETTGKTVYSKVLSVNLGKAGKGLSLYPNPVSGNQVTISLSNIKRGQYNIRVVNVGGQDIHKQIITNQSSNFTQTIDLPSSIKPGVYNMVITGDDYRESKMFIVQ